MGLINDKKLRVSNSIPNQTQQWTKEQCSIAWEMFVEGKSFIVIARVLGKNKKAVSRQIENQIDKHHRHPNTNYPRSRSHLQWSSRDLWIFNRAVRFQLPMTTIALLLGRAVEEIEELQSRNQNRRLLGR